MTSVRYWARKFHLISKAKGYRRGKPSTCAVCRRNKVTRRRICGSCTVKLWRYRTKLRAIELLGGQCSKCGWDKHPAGLTFHHTKGRKEFTLSHPNCKRWSVLKRELKKCVLLCANCHHVVHTTTDDPRFQAEIERYAEAHA